MDKVLAAWSLKTINEALNIHKHLANTGRSWDDVELYLKATARNKTAFAAERLNCPECGAQLQLLPVNNSPATQTGDDSRSVWICRGCFYEQFSTKTVKEETTALSRSGRGIG